MKQRSVLAIALLIVAVLVGDGIAIATHRSDDPSWDARVLPIVHFVEEHRGLRFKKAVPVDFLSDAAFQKQVAPDRTETAEEKKALEQFLGELRALSLVSGKVDLAKAEDDLTRSSIIGLYVPSRKKVFVRGTELTVAVRVVLAHELTHVLQDQYFDLTKIRKDAPGGDTTAVTALIEGDAVRVQDLYTAALSDADQKAYRTETLREARAAQSGSSGVPAVLSDFLGFPYAFGPVLLAQLGATGGNDEIDKAFRHPPSEEAQVFDPLNHPYTEDPMTLPQPVVPAGAARVGKPAPFGMVSLFEVLSTRLGYAAALTAVRGWKGDTSQTYTSGGRTCVAIDVKATGSALLLGARAWAVTTHAAVTTRSDVTSIRACDPGAAARIPTQPKPTPFDVLTARAVLLSTFVTKGAPLQRATCLADGLLARLGPGRYEVLLSTDLTPEQTTLLRDLVTTAAQACG
ncbi:MAG: hypothetical protein JWO22_912 [Frankiales bacterium]|nr:hypothetical protein [Frankiales bacterium]